MLSAATAGPKVRPAEPVLDARSALIVVDLQKSILTRPTLEPVDAVVGRTRQLLEAFRRARLPVVFVRSATQPPGRTQQPHRADGPVDPTRSELLPALGARGSDHIVSKQGWSAFSHTDLADYLARYRITQVVILGYSTSIAVESTARDAYDRGLNVTIVEDATTDTVADAHDVAMRKIFPRLGVVARAQTVAEQLAVR